MTGQTYRVGELFGGRGGMALGARLAGRRGNPAPITVFDCLSGSSRL